jgi:hypothetical protein
MMLLIKRAVINLNKQNRIISPYASKFYSTEKSNGGKQNTFYFEKSPLLSDEQAHKDPNTHTELYNNLPVVLLFGWTGSQDKQLKKYVKLYSSMGYHVLRFAPSNKLTFVDRHEHPKYTQHLHKLLTHDLKLTNNPIITHIFSNAVSFISYQHIIHAMNKRSDAWEFFKLNHRAAIYDSAPGLPVPFLRLWTGIADLNKSQNFLTRYLIATIVTSSYAVYHLGKLKKHYFTDAFEKIINDKRPVPTLVMYSEADKLIDPKSVDEMAERRKRLHTELYLKTVVYKDADHVLIYNKYPHEYVKHIKEHLEMSKLDTKTIFEQINKSSK